MKIMVDPQVEPVAHHTPVPAPPQWQDDIKAGFDHDVRLGVLEPVHIGEPVTLCQRMVVCAKKNDKPRRSDFSSIKCTCYKGNTSHSVSFSSS